MSAHHVRHAFACPAFGNQRLRWCTCDAPGAASARATVCDVCLADPGIPCNVAEHERAEGHPATKEGMPPAQVARHLRENRPIVMSEDLTRTNDERLARDQAAAERMEQPRRTGSGYPGGGVDRSRPPIVHAPPDREPSRDEASALSSQLSALLERQVGVGISREGWIEVWQHCRACRADIDATLAPPREKDRVTRFGIVGLAARKAYLKHVCPPVDRSLLALTYAELEELHVELEREGTKLIQRALEVKALIKRQGS